MLLIGNPFGLGHSVSRGSISGLNRRVELGSRQLGGLIQVDAALHPGDSGALVADLHGGWLGVIRSGHHLIRTGPISSLNDSLHTLVLSNKSLRKVMEWPQKILAFLRSLIFGFIASI